MGGGASKSKTKQIKKDVEIQRKKDKTELLASLKVEKEQKVTTGTRGAREDQRMIDNNLYRASVGSPQRRENMIMDVLPDYMLNKAALKHTEEMKQKKAEEYIQEKTLEPVQEKPLDAATMKQTNSQ